jgi:TPR repeat protein
MRKRSWQWLVAGALLVCAAPVTAQSVKAGIDAWQRGDYVRAVKAWRPLAEAGDVDASFNLGQAYRLGRGVPLDLGTAQTWLERAARKGHIDAQTTLGLLLFQSGNRIGGLRWLKQAADKGEPRALLMYGTALFNGDGIPQDPVLAYAFVSRAAAQGLAPAKATLEQMDSILPLEQRKKGLAISKAKASAAQKEATAALKPPPSKTAPKLAVASAAPKPAMNGAAQAKSISSASGGSWRIQLGAFAQRASAESLFRRLSGSAPIAGRQMVLVPAGGVTRLQVGPFESRAAASAACRALASRGQACFPAPAR